MSNVRAVRLLRGVVGGSRREAAQGEGGRDQGGEA